MSRGALEQQIDQVDERAHACATREWLMSFATASPEVRRLMTPEVQRLFECACRIGYMAGVEATVKALVDSPPA